MLVYEIPRKYSAAFADFTPENILKNMGRRGFYTLGQVFYADGEHYAAGILQFYIDKKAGERFAKITYLYVPEEERGESNAWALLREMKSVLTDMGIRRAGIYLAGNDEAALKTYMIKRGFTVSAAKPPLLRTTLRYVFSEKVLSTPASKAVSSLKTVQEVEVKRILKELPEDELKEAGIDTGGGEAFYDRKLSYIYRDEKTKGILLAGVVPEGGVVFNLCRCIGKDKVKATLAMVAEAGRVLMNICPSDTPLYIPCSVESTEAALRKIDPEIRLYRVWKGEIRYV